MTDWNAEDDRFWSQVDKTDTCWLWHGKIDSSGYGQFTLTSAPRTYRQAHLWLWDRFGRPIPDGYQLDHLCRVRNCVNPHHLEPVTPRENSLRSTAPSAAHARKTRCVNGHPFDTVDPDHPHRRMCLTCQAERSRAFTGRNPGYYTKYTQRRRAKNRG